MRGTGAPTSLAAFWRPDSGSSAIASTTEQAASIWDGTKQIVGAQIVFNGASSTYSYYAKGSFSAGTVTTPANVGATTVSRASIGALVRNTVSAYFPMHLYQLVIVPNASISEPDRTNLINFLSNY